MLIMSNQEQLPISASYESTPSNEGFLETQDPALILAELKDRYRNEENQVPHFSLEWIKIKTLLELVDHSVPNETSSVNRASGIPAGPISIIAAQAALLSGSDTRRGFLKRLALASAIGVAGSALSSCATQTERPIQPEKAADLSIIVPEVFVTRGRFLNLLEQLQKTDWGKPIINYFSQPTSHYENIDLKTIANCQEVKNGYQRLTRSILSAATVYHLNKILNKQQLVYSWDDIEMIMFGTLLEEEKNEPEQRQTLTKLGENFLTHGISHSAKEHILIDALGQHLPAKYHWRVTAGEDGVNLRRFPTTIENNPITMLKPAANEQPGGEALIAARLNREGGTWFETHARNILSQDVVRSSSWEPESLGIVFFSADHATATWPSR